MINIITQKFREQSKGILYYLAGLILYSWMIIGLYPYIETMKSATLEQMPENLIKFFGGDALAMTRFEGFISIEFLSLFFVLIVCFYVGSSAGSTIAGSLEKKTLDFQLSQPITRTKLVLSESIVTLFSTALLVLATSLSIFVLCKIYNIEVKENGLWAFSAVATAFLWSVYGIAILISSILRSKITVAAATILIVMGFYVFTAMTKIVDKLSNYDKLSLFYTYNPQKLLESGQVNIDQIIILFTICLAGLLGSLVVFNNKDL